MMISRAEVSIHGGPLGRAQQAVGQPCATRIDLHDQVLTTSSLSISRRRRYEGKCLVASFMSCQPAPAQVRVSTAAWLWVGRFHICRSFWATVALVRGSPGRGTTGWRNI